MEATCSSEILVHFQWTTWHYSQEETTQHSNKCLGFIKGWKILDYLQLETCVALGITTIIWPTGLNWHLNAKQ
jgi:hypothetical protein